MHGRPPSFTSRRTVFSLDRRRGHPAPWHQRGIIKMPIGVVKGKLWLLAHKSSLRFQAQGLDDGAQRDSQLLFGEMRTYLDSTANQHRGGWGGHCRDKQSLTTPVDYECRARLHLVLNETCLVKLNDRDAVWSFTPTASHDAPSIPLILLRRANTTSYVHNVRYRTSTSPSSSALHTHASHGRWDGQAYPSDVFGVATYVPPG